jgi:thioredoxin-like negative regulator of GroEL
MEITMENFKNFIEENSSKLTIIEYGAEWCSPCRGMKPIMKDLAEKMSDVFVLGIVDVNDQRDLAIDQKVKSLPTLHIYKNGELVDQRVGGLLRPAILEIIDKYSK